MKMEIIIKIISNLFQINMIKIMIKIIIMNINQIINMIKIFNNKTKYKTIKHQIYKSQVINNPINQHNKMILKNNI